ncbi:MAG: peptide deformylase [Steroidobacteraceae bacterium]
MALVPIVLFGDPVLRSPTQPITVFDKRLRTLVADLLDTVDEPGRAGLAATQIGVDLRAFSYNVDGKRGYVLNPEIVELSEEAQRGDEACLSVPDLWYPTTRARHATVRGVDIDNEPVAVSGSDLMARCLQHEVDHLDGLLYLDRLEPPERKAAMRAIREQDWSSV